MMPLLMGPAGTMSFRTFVPCFMRAASNGSSRSYQRPWIECRGMAPSSSRRSTWPAGWSLTLTSIARALVPQMASRSVALPRGGLGQVERDGIGRGSPVAADAGKGDRAGVGVFVVRHVLEKPVLPKIALADHIVHIVGKERGVLQRDRRVGVFSPWKNSEPLRLGMPISQSCLPRRTGVQVSLPRSSGWPAQP